MMLRIRLARRGKKRQPSYRVVVADSKSPRDGKYVEQIGRYDPMTNPSTFSIKEGRALYWLSVGAQPSDAVRRLLDKSGVIALLKRLHAGESMEALVAEVDGVAAPAVEESIEEVVEDAAEAVEEVVEDAAEAVEEVVEDAAEAVEEVVEDAAEAVEEVVEDASSED
ncbi:MAG TPA: 30S ribosomal protein S16 [Anaerolineae bacterium]|nr:30S ribosomal protein S16 [Anaerolineae bacterium]